MSEVDKGDSGEEEAHGGAPEEAGMAEPEQPPADLPSESEAEPGIKSASEPGAEPTAEPGAEPAAEGLPGAGPDLSQADHKTRDADAEAVLLGQAPKNAVQHRSGRLTKTPAHILIYGMRLVLMAVCLSILAVTALLWMPPEYLLAWIADDVEKLLLDQTGLPLKIGRVTRLEVRPQHQKLDMQNLYLYGHREARIPFAVVPVATLETDLLSFLFKQPQVTLIRVFGPQLRVIRDRQGRINLRPEIKKSDQPPSEEPMRLPRAKLAIQNLIVMIRNESDDFAISESVHLPIVNADLSDAGLALIYGNLRSDLFTFRGKAQIAVEEGVGWATGKVASVDLDNVNQYTRMVRDLNFQKGRFRGEIWANWDDYSMKGLRYTGLLELDHVWADVPFFNRPVVATGLARLDEKRVSLDRLQLETGGSVMHASGWLTDYIDDPLMDLRINSKRLEIGPILRGLEIKDLKPVLAMRPEGVLTGDIRARGRVKQPDKLAFSGDVGLPYFRMTDVAVEAARASFSFADQRLKSQIWLPRGSWQDVRLYDGAAQVDYRLKTGHLSSTVQIAEGRWQQAVLSNADATIDYRLKSQRLQGIVTLARGSWLDAHLDNARAIVDYQGKANRFKGELFIGSGAWQDVTMASARGVVDYANNRASGKIWLQQAAYQNADLANGELSFRYRPDRLDAQLAVASGRYTDAEIRSLRAGIIYTPAALYIQDLYANAFAGSIAGEATIGLQANKAIQASLDARNLSLAQLQSAFNTNLPGDYRPVGSFSLAARASGTLDNPSAVANFSSPRISFPYGNLLAPLNDFKGIARYSKPLATLAMSTRSDDAGLIKAAASLRNLDGLQARIEAESLPLQMANKFAPEAYVESGSARLQAQMAGSLRAMRRSWMDFTGSASLLANDLNLRLPEGIGNAKEPITQHLDLADIRLGWNRGLADIQKLEIRNDDSIFTGDGTLSVARLMSPKDRDHAFTGSLTGSVDVEDFPVLSAFDLTGGHVELALEADTLRSGDIVASLTSTGEHMQYRGVNLDSFRVDSAYANQLLTIREAKLIQDEDSFALKGTVDFKTSSPSLNLNARADDFGLQTLVGLIPPDMRKQFEPGPEDKPLPPPDDMPTSYQLPRINTRPIFRPDVETVLENIKADELVISWKEVYDHWDHYKLAPGNEPYTPVIGEQQRLLDTLKGNLSLDADIKGTVAKPDLDVQALIQELEIQDAGVAETYLDAALKDQKLDFRHFYLLEKEGGLLRVSGDVDLNKDLNLEIDGEGLRLDIARPFLGPNLRLNGTLDFLAVAEGPLKNPQVTAEADIDRLLVNRYFFDNLGSLLGYRDGYLRDTRVELNTGSQQVIAYGDIPIPDLSKPMEVSLQLEDDSFGLLNLFTNAIDWRGGKGSLLVKVVGSPSSPQLEGSINLDDTELYIPSLKESLTDFDLKGELTRKIDNNQVQQNINIALAQGKFGGGTVQAAGELDLMDMIPSYYNITTKLDQVTLNYTQPGLFNTTTPIEHAEIKIRGLLNLPIISGNIRIGKEGKIYFPFLKDRQDIPVSNSVESDAAVASQPKFLLGGLKLIVPYSYHLNSPLFDILVNSPSGFEFRQRGEQAGFQMNGSLQSERGKIYLLNNVLTVEQLNVASKYPDASNPTALAFNPSFVLDTSFNIQGANEPVKANISGSLEDVSSNTLKFVFSNTQGLSETQILAQLTGFGAVESLAQGDISSVAMQFSESVLRGLFDPLTSRISSLLGLEELSFGIAGQSARGPVFKFTVRSNPFFFIDEYIEENLSQLEFLNRIRLRATGYLDEQNTYEIGSSYRFNDFWALDYKYEQIGSIHTVKANGNYLLDFVLRWADYVRSNYFGWDDTSLETSDRQSPEVIDPSVTPSENPAKKETEDPARGSDSESGSSGETPTGPVGTGGSFGPAMW